jgi:hypothetical protein
LASRFASVLFPAADGPSIAIINALTVSSAMYSLGRADPVARKIQGMKY